ncbi:ATP-binding cassette domain-containing protein [Paenibacillus sp. TRM 82003]|nr:ATP-binding cassette domain-containing protein [Paenibacillus sp. TRM 82003]
MQGGAVERAAAIEGVSLTIQESAWTAVVGGNGSGKSTLSKVLAGLCPLTSGRRSLADGRRAFMVMQQPDTQILGETVGEELALCAAGGGDADLYRGALEEAGLNVAPDTPVKRLSGGQKQLLNVAGCLVAGADVIVFDEATSMLDPSSRGTVLDAAAALRRRGRTVVWVTHRMEELREADRVLAMRDGRIAFDGTSEAFFYGEAAAEGAEGAEGASPCERLGLEPPYAVRATQALRRQGIDLGARPLSSESFAEAVRRYVP